jgi:integrase
VFVVSPHLFAHECCPRFLTRAEIRAVLSAVDRRTPLGLRDYAILLLLSTYGLRGIEVIRLRLEDIDWRNERIRIRARKAGNETVYPLAPSVGRAVLAYLKRGRPVSPDREIFVSEAAPFRALRRTSALGCVARKHFAKAGIHVERPGAHTFRYSCAQALLEDQTPLKTIADFLGHRDPSSTHRYTMIALDDLRGVAMGDGEDLL